MMLFQATVLVPSVRAVDIRRQELDEAHSLFYHASGQQALPPEDLGFRFGGRFGVNIVPHTLQATGFDALAPGSRVNVEVDLVARYLERLRG